MLGIGTNIAAGAGSWLFIYIEKKFGSKNVIVFSLVLIFFISLIILFINVKKYFHHFSYTLKFFFWTNPISK